MFSLRVPKRASSLNKRRKCALVRAAGQTHLVIFPRRRHPRRFVCKSSAVVARYLAATDPLDQAVAGAMGPLLVAVAAVVGGLLAVGWERPVGL